MEGANISPRKVPPRTLSDTTSKYAYIYTLMQQLSRSNGKVAVKFLGIAWIPGNELTIFLRYILRGMHFINVRYTYFSVLQVSQHESLHFCQL